MQTQTLLIVPTESGIGLTSACLGLIRALDYTGIKAGFFKPVLQSEFNPDGSDNTSLLVTNTLKQTPPKPIEQQRIERMIGDDQLDDLMEEVVAKHHQVAENYKVVVCEAVVPKGDSSYAAQVNLALAHALDARIILVSTADLEDPEHLADKIDMHARAFGGVAASRTIGCILTRVKNLPDELQVGAVVPGEANIHLSDNVIKKIRSHSPAFATDRFHLIGLVPYSETLSVPRTWDVAHRIGAKLLNEGEAKTRRVLHAKVTARTVANALEAFTPNTLIVCPGDRDDLMLAAALKTMNGTPLAGLMLTGNLMPSKSVIELCTPALKTGLPVLSINTDSYTTVKALSQLDSEIPPDDKERAEKVTRFVAAHLDLNWLKEHFSKGHTPRLSPSAFRHQLVKKAKQAVKRIVLPEGAEPRTIEAASICQSRGIAQCVLLAKREEVETVAKSRGINLPDGLEIIDPDSIQHNYVDAMVVRRKGKLTEPMAESQLQDTVVLGTMMLYLGEVDGLVSGAVHTTANTVRPAFQLIKTAPDYSLVSSIFFMLLPEQVVVYGDCAINPEPDATQLAEIAIQSAKSAKAFGIEPKVAMISYSTGESGTGKDVDKVREATRIAKERAPDLLIDGPLQYDAAAIESVGKQKAPNSKVAGQATVFVFPDLNTGNTTYKAVQRSANVVSVGPMLQGLNKPVNDLSRGALVDDIVYTIALTAIQAASDEI